MTKKDFKDLGEECFNHLKELNPKVDMKEIIRLAVEFGYKKATAPVIESPSFWFMRDNHSFVKPYGDTLSEIVDSLINISMKNPYGMVCPVAILNQDNIEIRRVGQPAHVDSLGNVSLTEWIREILVEPCVAQYKETKNKG